MEHLDTTSGPARGEPEAGEARRERRIRRVTEALPHPIEDSPPLPLAACDCDNNCPVYTDVCGVYG